MTAMIKTLAINGSYRDDGMTYQAVEAFAEALKAAGALVVILSDENSLWGATVVIGNFVNIS